MEDGQIEICSAVISFTMSSLFKKKEKKECDLKRTFFQKFFRWNYEILTRTLWSFTKSDKIIVKTNGSYEKENKESLNIIYILIFLYQPQGYQVLSFKRFLPLWKLSPALVRSTLEINIIFNLMKEITTHN